MSNLHGIDCEDGDSRVDTEALQAGQQRVGADKEGNHCHWAPSRGKKLFTTIDDGKADVSAQLNDLDLSYSAATDADVSFVASHFPHLTRLSLDGCDCVSDASSGFWPFFFA